MTFRSFLKAGITTGALLATTLPAFAEKFLILDILPIRDGQSLADAEAYFAAVEPIFARYGMTRSDAVLSVVDILRGPVEAEVVNLWETDNPQAAFDGIFSDEEYLTHTGSRDTIFDLKAATIVVTERQGS